MASSDTGGVKPFAIGRRMVREQERLIGMTEEERAWRAQYLKDQILAPDEPAVDEIKAWQQSLNPIRRFYRAPLDKFGDMLIPTLGRDHAYVVRYLTGKLFLGIGFAYAAFYYFKYNQNDWTRKGGWRVISSRKAVVPGDANYPEPPQRTKPSDYSDRGFSKSII